LKNEVFGVTNKKTVLLDLDGIPFKQAKKWSTTTMKYHKLKGFIILKSSDNHYHAVFDRKVSWARNMSIVAWVCLKSHNKEMVKWFIMQCIKGDSTLRVSPKQNKKSPRIVYRFGSQNNRIKHYLECRKLALKGYNS
jgi:hypothetical protein